MLFKVLLGIVIYFFICDGGLQTTAEDATTSEAPVATPQIIANPVANDSFSTSTVSAVKPDAKSRLNNDTGNVTTADSDHKKLALGTLKFDRRYVSCEFNFSIPRKTFTYFLFKYYFKYLHLPSKDKADILFSEAAMKRIALENTTHLELHAKMFGDILIPHHEREASKNATYKLKNAITDPNLKWPNNKIYYVIDYMYNAQERETITDAMNYLQQEVGCIEFVAVDQTYTGHHILVTDNNSGCHSFVGYRPGAKQGTNDQDVNIDRYNGCFKGGAVQHELLHALGLDHEQSRPDRDDYVYIYTQNIMPGYEFNFNIAPQSTTFGVPYDYGSVLHYFNTAFGIVDSNGQPLVTIVARKNPQMCLGQYDKATQCDLEKVRHIYNCPLKNNCAPSERQPNPQTNSCYY